MDERERAARALVLEVRVVAAQLRRREHPLVDDRAGREARHDRVAARLELEAAPNHVELALERILVVRRGPAGGDDQLPDEGGRLRRGAAGEGRIDRDVAPANDGLPFLCHDRLEQRLELATPAGLVRKEAHCDAVPTGRRQRGADDPAEERIRDLQEDPGTVTRARVGPCSATMLEVLERLQRPLHGLAQRRPVEPCDERDAAGIVLVVGRVEALLVLLRGAHSAHPLRGWESGGFEIRRSTHAISPRLAVSSAGAIAKHDFKD